MSRNERYSIIATNIQGCGDIEILLDLEAKKTVKLKELIPDWWGYGRFE